MHKPISPSLRTIIADTTDPAVRHVLHRDYETRGQLLLERVGTHRYAADPGTHVLCCAFAIDDQTGAIVDPRASSATGIY